MQKTIVCIVVLFFFACGSKETQDSDLKAGFINPGNESRPRAYWNWLNGDVSLPDLTFDLKEAKDKGLGGLEMWDTEAMRNPNGFVPAGPPFMGSESVAAMHHSMKEAKRLGLDLGLITSSGWNAGGAWVTPEMASKTLFFSNVIINGPGQIKQKLPFPEVPQDCPKGENGLPQWYQEVAVLAWPDTEEKVIPVLSEVINLTNKAKNGELTWTLPAGSWQVVRFVCTNNGQQLIAASPNSKGPFIDFLDPEATRFHFEYILNKLGIKKGGDPNSPLKSLEVDSMELYHGIQWTKKFREWFKEYHGYDPVEWLPVLLGWTIKDEKESNRFQYDYNKTVSDLLIFSHYTTGSNVCAEYGLVLAGEAGGPGPPFWNSCPVDALKALGNVQIPRGEFWLGNPRNLFLVKEIACASHIYGKKYVDAESWTTWRRWRDSPFVRKQLVDRAFCEGLNRITYHGFSNSPEKFGYPGRSYHAGIDMNPRVVWWSKARPFMDYLARCCYMLQQGLYVADVAYFYGDQAPNFWPLYHNVPENPPLEGLGKGYSYDVVNSDVILNRMSVKNGRILFPDGMSYRVLVLPDQKHMPLEVLLKLEKLVAEGATIIGPKPSDVPGMKDYVTRTKKLRELAGKMWRDCNGNTVQQNSYGKGKVVWGLTPQQWLEQESVVPDFACQTDEHANNLDFIHRETEDKDIYFVRNKSLLSLNTDCFFRVSNATPELWNPTDGSIKSHFLFCESEGGTNVMLNLPPRGSVFVVFSKGTKSNTIKSVVRTGKNIIATFPVQQVVDVDKSSAIIQCWRNGEYIVTNRKGKKKEFVLNSLSEPIQLDGEWKVEFNSEWGAPAEVMLPNLISWTEHENKGIKYYSGAGMYTRKVNVPKDWLVDGKSICLDLGDVRELAEVFVNGKSAGVLWKKPFCTDVTSLLTSGINELQVEVMNMWINRLAGDKDLPEADRFTKTNITADGGTWLENWTEWSAEPAGLLGPVRLLSSVDVQVELD